MKVRTGFLNRLKREKQNDAWIMANMLSPHSKKRLSSKDFYDPEREEAQSKISDAERFKIEFEMAALSKEEKVKAAVEQIFKNKKE